MNKSSQKKIYKVIYWKLIIGTTAIALLFIYALVYYQKQRPETTSFPDQNLCRQQNRAQIAEELNLDYNYAHDDKFGYPTLQITMTASDKKRMQEAYSLSYKDDDLNHIMVYSDKTGKDAVCHLNGVKHHVKNINPKLLSYIPDDADHVSYSPFDDKAVYCHYSTKSNNASSCFYISLSKDRLVKDDISDMERANLTLANQRQRTKQDLDKFGFAHSYITKWTNNPEYLYGIEFNTKYNGEYGHIKQTF